jgi:hypothetical protein
MSNYLWLQRNGNAAERKTAAQLTADHTCGYRRALEDLVFAVMARLSGQITTEWDAALGMLVVTS